ncbi:MAG: hypothetical protein AAGC56_15355 [Pseudomonadota bacterium]
MVIALSAFALLSATAVVGAMIGLKTIKSEPSPALMSFLHFMLAGVGATLLAEIAFRAGADGALKIALYVFAAAAAGGFVLLSFRMMETYPPTFLVIGHALAGVGGLGVLAVAALA